MNTSQLKGPVQTLCGRHLLWAQGHLKTAETTSPMPLACFPYRDSNMQDCITTKTLATFCHFRQPIEPPPFFFTLSVKLNQTNPKSNVLNWLTYCWFDCCWSGKRGAQFASARACSRKQGKHHMNKRCCRVKLSHIVILQPFHWFGSTEQCVAFTQKALNLYSIKDWWWWWFMQVGLRMQMPTFMWILIPRLHCRITGLQATGRPLDFTP